MPKCTHTNTLRCKLKLFICATVKINNSALRFSIFVFCVAKWPCLHCSSIRTSTKLVENSSKARMLWSKKALRVSKTFPPVCEFSAFVKITICGASYSEAEFHFSLYFFRSFHWILIIYLRMKKLIPDIGWFEKLSSAEKLIVNSWNK